jgi:hypothetical protein
MELLGAILVAIVSAVTVPSWALGSRGVGRARNRNWTLLIHGVKLLASHRRNNSFA